MTEKTRALNNTVTKLLKVECQQVAGYQPYPREAAGDYDLAVLKSLQDSFPDAETHGMVQR